MTPPEIRELAESVLAARGVAKLAVLVTTGVICRELELVTVARLDKALEILAHHDAVLRGTLERRARQAELVAMVEAGATEEEVLERGKTWGWSRVTTRRYVADALKGSE